jgi:hypothetical protein
VFARADLVLRPVTATNKLRLSDSSYSQFGDERSADNRQLGPFHEGMDHIAPAPLPSGRGMDYSKETHFWCFVRLRTQMIKGFTLAG